MKGFFGPRTRTRLLVVFGLLLLSLTLRLDQAVRTAYASHWVAKGEGGAVQTYLDCSRCLRLPASGWPWAHAAVGVLALGMLWAAAFIRHRRVGGDATRPALRHISLAAAAVAAVAALAAGVLRLLAGFGFTGGAVKGAAACTFIALGAIAALALASVQADRDTTKFLSSLRLLLQRQRMNLIGVAVLGVLLLFVKDTSGQAIDSIRTWTAPTAGGAARLTFGLATAILLALVVYESGVRLNAVRREQTRVPAKRLLATGAVLAAVGLVLVLAGPFGYGLIFAGAIVALVGVLELPQHAPAFADDGAKQDVPEPYAPEWLAVVPLFALGATSVSAMVDAMLTGGVNGGSLVTGLPALVVGAAAVLMTREGPPPALGGPRPWTLLSVGALVVVPAVVLALAFPSSKGVAAFGGLCCAAVLFYTVFTFRVEPRHPFLRGVREVALSVPLAIAAGVGMQLALLSSPIPAGRALGVFALVNIAFAFALAVMHYAVRAAVRWQPPTVLGWFGMQQVPLFTFIFLWWLLVGLIGFPKTMHDARLVDHRAVGGATQPRPTLDAAFKAWVAGQEDLNTGAADEAVPLVLVAAHGGGIRAAYWTALALDCIVGVSSDPVGTLPKGELDEDTRNATCLHRRRDVDEQRRAVRRIFLTSGVSGGAVGLYAFTRQLLHNGWLADGRWINDRLEDDFAGPTIGWALFHDLPNRLFGLHPHSGGICSAHLGSVCLSDDRAAILESTFDEEWNVPDEEALLRLTYDLRSSPDELAKANAQIVPLYIGNSTLTGGASRAIVSAVDAGAWPSPDVTDRGRGFVDKMPLAGTIEISDALCETKDMRLSTAAFLAARFPYVTPSGHMPGHCGAGDGKAATGDAATLCATLPPSGCEGRFVDGGYIDNSGLFTITTLWPALKALVVDYNRAHPNTRKIAPLIVELDNHYQASLQATVPRGGATQETLIPIVTAFGGRSSAQTYARALAYRLLPPTCVVTVSPSLHPGLTAPLGWELSRGARDDLRAARVRPHPEQAGVARDQAALQFRGLQARLGGEPDPNPLNAPLSSCAPS